MKTITLKNAKTKTEIAALIYAHKLDDFNSFTSLVEILLDRYATEISRGRMSTAFYSGFTGSFNTWYKKWQQAYILESNQED